MTGWGGCKFRGTCGCKFQGTCWVGVGIRVVVGPEVEDVVMGFRSAPGVARVRCITPRGWGGSVKVKVGVEARAWVGVGVRVVVGLTSY